VTNVVTIALKEMKVYFTSPLFYVVTAFFTAIYAFLFYISPIANSSASLSDTFGLAIFLFVLFAPIMTMRLIAQEKQAGTLELLLSNPIRDWEVVVGKWAASMAMFTAMLSTTLISILVILWTSVDRGHFLFLNVGKLDLMAVLVGYLGFILIGGGYMAIGLLASTVTQNQIIAAVVGIVALLVLLIAAGASALTQPPLSDFFGYLGSSQHVAAFARGAVALPDVVYALTMIGVPLYLSVVALGARRWH
jgi:ABC-2 type transport system permease protein